MSPERLESKEYSFPSDIWSFGIIIFEMAVGGHPFPLTDSPIEIYKFLLQRDAPSLIGNPRVSIELANFVSRCL